MMYVTWYSVCTLSLVFLGNSYGHNLRFTRFPPPILYVERGHTGRFEWNYTVEDKKTQFDSISPQWLFFVNNTIKVIAYDIHVGNNWNFVVSPKDCPDHLKLRLIKKSKATLVITGVIDADNGKYGCKLKLANGSEIISTSVLIVTNTPKLTVKPDHSISIKEHSELNVICNAVGPPSPNVTWIRNNTKNAIIQGVGSATLRIKNITRNQGGTYKCLGINNPNLDPVIKNVVVLVNYAPEIGKNFEQQSYCIGDKVRLDCVAVGNPKPNVTWSGPSGQKVDPSADLKMKEDKEFGNYTCFARNLVGSASYVLRLVKKNVSCQPPVTKPTPSPTDDVHPGIIAGVVIAALLAIAGLIIAIIFWKRRKLYTKDSENRNERSVRMNAIGDDDNVYATTQQPNREAPDRAQPTVQYAAVDKSKKTKKKRPGEGELIYADLDHETPAGERPPSDRRSTGGSGDQPTLYADIGSTRQETPRYGNLQDMDSM